MSINLYFGALSTTKPLLLTLIAKELGISDLNRLKIVKNNFGKPGLMVLEAGSNKFIPAPRQFNLTHSKDFGALVTSDGKVGVDLEKLRLDAPRYANRWIAKLDLPPFSGADSSPKLQARYFLSWWTLIEALVKYFGSSIWHWPHSAAFKTLKPELEDAFDAIWVLSLSGSLDQAATTIKIATPISSRALNLAYFSYLDTLGWIVSAKPFDKLKAFTVNSYGKCDLINFSS